MGIFSDMIRGIVAEELKAMVTEGAADQSTGATEPESGSTDQNAGATEPEKGAAEPEAGASDSDHNKETTSDPELRALLRKELRDYMASELNGEATEGDMPTAEEALCSILGLGQKEKE